MMNDTIFSIFSGTKIKTDDGVNMISNGDNNCILHSSKCEFSFLNKDYPLCKHCRPLINKLYNTINSISQLRNTK